MSTSTAAALAHVVAGLDSAEQRTGQLEMAQATADAIENQQHLIVQAGTGTGKTIAYLTASAASGKRTVVVTATKALQDQLANKDLPFVAARLAELDINLDFAILKGRSNYLCLQRLHETRSPDDDLQLSLDEASLSAGTSAAGATSEVLTAEIQRLSDWAADTTTGDMAELDWSPTDQAWQAVSVGSDECPGANRCPVGSGCFAERARYRAQEADVIVVNTHLYGLNVGAEGALLPDHDVVVFDEAHVIEDIMSDTVGAQLAPGRFLTVAQAVRRILEDPQVIASLSDLTSALREVLREHLGERLSVPLPSDVANELHHELTQVTRAQEAVTRVGNIDNEDVQQRKLRAQRLLDRTQETIEAVIAVDQRSVPFVSGRPESPRLEVAPLDVGPTLAEGVWSQRTAILTSATIPATLRERVGLPRDNTTEVDVGSPFEYEKQGILYCARHLPEPKSPNFRDEAAEEIVTLIEAAGGRTLALFTSWAGLDHAADVARESLDLEILTQRDLPKPALIERFTQHPETCLFATSGMFQGVDVPGDTLSLVIIDKLPFPRPDDPLLSARREQLGSSAFGQIDIPRASTMLAQAVGRLIRSADDRGVVAVLDRRLATARYRWDFVNALPPMRRTRHLNEVTEFLTSLH